MSASPDPAPAEPVGRSDPWLVIIDMQHVFADPGSEWCAPGTSELVPVVSSLSDRFAGRTVCTRFVAPAVPAGSWVDYYRTWPWARRPASDPLWDLLTGLPATPVVDAATFSKWGPDLSAATGGADHLVICGVATDCCVLMTALAAADAGATVRVVGDACAAGDGPTHDRALALLAPYEPMITVTTVAEELDG